MIDEEESFTTFKVACVALTILAYEPSILALKAVTEIIRLSVFTAFFLQFFNFLLLHKV